MAALAGGGWWLETHVFQPPPVPVDPHRILSLPITTDLMNPNATLQYLEYTWFPDSTHLAIAADKVLFQVDVKTGQRALVSSSQAPTLLTHWSEDRKQLLVEGLGLGPAGAGYTHVVWPDPFHAYTLPFTDLDLRLGLGQRRAVSPDETLVAVAEVTTLQGNLSIQIWNIQEQRFVLQCQHPISGLLDNFALVWSPDSAALAVYTGGYGSSSPPTVQVWQVSDGRLLWQADVSHPGNAGTEQYGWIKWSPAGTALAFAYLAQTPRLGVLDAHTGVSRFQTTLARPPIDWFEETFAWSPDGTRLAMLAREQGTPAIQVWDARLGQPLLTCQRVSGMPPYTVSWSPDGKTLAAGTMPTSAAETTLQFWEAQHGQALFSYYAPERPAQLLWSPDSQFLATFTPQNTTSCAQGTFCHPSPTDFALQVFQVR